MATCRLLAIDLDGTLVRDDGEIAPEDRAAVARACASGMEVTIATGRLGPAALPLARGLDLRRPVVCADGGATFCPRTAALLEVTSLPLLSLEWLLDAASADGVTPFLMTPESIVGPRGATAFGTLSGWTPILAAVDDLRALAFDGPPSHVLAAFAVGDEASVRALCARLPERQDDCLETDVFSLGDREHWALRLTPAGASKAAALERIAAGLGLSAAEVATIGDWYNDIAMLRWASRSYAMGQSPEPVVRAARHRLRATARTGGGVAEALEHILGSARASIG